MPKLSPLIWLCADKWAAKQGSVRQISHSRESWLIHATSLKQVDWLVLKSHTPQWQANGNNIWDLAARWNDSKVVVFTLFPCFHAACEESCVPPQDDPSGRCVDKRGWRESLMEWMSEWWMVDRGRRRFGLTKGPTYITLGVHFVSLFRQHAPF